MVVIILWKKILTGWVLNLRKEHYRKLYSFLSTFHWFPEYVSVCSSLSLIPQKSSWLYFSLVKWRTLHTDIYTNKPIYFVSIQQDIFWTMGDSTEVTRNFKSKEVSAEAEQEEAWFLFFLTWAIAPRSSHLHCLFCTFPLSRLGLTIMFICHI